MKVRYTQWAEDDRWTVEHIEELVTRLLADGWKVSVLLECAVHRQLWLDSADGKSGIQIEVRTEDQPA